MGQEPSERRKVREIHGDNLGGEERKKLVREMRRAL
jgi:hypothetical protein